MKNYRKTLSILCVAIALSLAVVPLAGWTSVVYAEVAEKPNSMYTSVDDGIQPLYGGQEKYKLSFIGGYIEFEVAAGNWIFPWADEAVITVSSNSDDARYGFDVTFVWTNTNKWTHWYVPGNYNSSLENPLRPLEINNGKFEIELTKNCDAGELNGNPGDRWACDHIDITFSAQIGNEPIQTETHTVYF